MALYHSPKIVTDGLVLCLDAANVRSYPGSGTSWYDLSGNGNTFTWSGASWNSSGYFNTSGYVATGPASNSLGITNSSGYTIFVVFQTLTGSSNGLFKLYSSNANDATSRAIFCHPSWTVGTIYFDQGGCCSADQRITATLPAYNQWVVMGLRSTVVTRSILLNGSETTSTSTAAANINPSSRAMAINPSDEGYNWNGRIAYFSIYNRGMSNTEYVQNYNALRNRFGV